MTFLVWQPVGKLTNTGHETHRLCCCCFCCFVLCESKQSTEIVVKDPASKTRHSFKDQRDPSKNTNSHLPGCKSTLMFFLLGSFPSSSTSLSKWQKTLKKKKTEKKKQTKKRRDIYFVSKAPPSSGGGNNPFYLGDFFVFNSNLKKSHARFIILIFAQRKCQLTYALRHFA